MAYTDIDKPSDYFNSAIYTGDGSQTRTISGVGFQPDLVIHKIRVGSGQGHSVFDSVRGFAGAKCLQTNTTAAEGTANGANAAEYGFVSGVNSDGYTVNDGTAVTNGGYVNRNTFTYVSWNWKAGTSFSNNAGANGASLASTGSVSTTAGFSIVKWTGNNSGSATVGHGLGTIPNVVIIKKLDGTSNWGVKHSSMTSGHMAVLNATDASSNRNGSTNGGIGNLTSSTTFGFIGGGAGTPEINNGSMIAYCFSERKGYSKFGSYKGNGNADGTFVYTGFKPAFMMVKRAIGGTGSWGITDGTRDPFNAVDNYLSANNDNTESDFDHADFLSNGIKFRTNNDGWNQSGNTYIYMAFASNPFVTSTGVPATAR